MPIFLLLVLLYWYPTIGAAQRVDTVYVPYVDTLYMAPPATIGWTQCDDAGLLAESWIRIDLLGTAQGREVMLHEAKHREQASRLPTCNDFLQKYNIERKFAARAEAEAYCAGLPEATVPYEEAMHRYTLAMEHVFRGTPEIYLRSLLNEYCGQPTGP
jgi:hypothetical protein